jgi:hypothetical protein
MSDVKNAVCPEHRILATFICHRIYRKSKYFPNIRTYLNPSYRKKYAKSWSKLTELVKFFTVNGIDPEDYIRVVVSTVQPEIFTPFQLLTKRCRLVWQAELVKREETKIVKALIADVKKFMSTGSLRLLVNPTHELVFEFSKYFLVLIPNIERILKKLGNDVFYEAFISDNDFIEIQKQTLNLFFKRYNVVPKQLSESVALILTDKEYT